ncbi:hypothetical protein OJ253_2813 [Cryptosporidium canis]|uniref:Uncharacterized protein n=1 Tax=Cryptosporidium canis TaxID=195482 RepID=A0A9D5HWF4_9CRYT|nr:hypothetical protein OJ253_2813 [Cryptosporidium canis]
MKQYSPVDIALDDDLFYCYRLSMNIFDSFISKDQVETIKSALQDKKSSKNSNIDLYRYELLKKINLKENHVAVEQFNDANNFFSSIGKINNEFIHILFQFDEIVKLNDDNLNTIVGNELISCCFGTHESSACTVSPISPNIIGFLDYIDTRDDIVNEFISKYNKNIYSHLTFIGNKQTYCKNDIYIKLLLRISFIKSICVLKIYGKKLPVYLFDGSKLLIKIEPIFHPSSEGCTISYEIVNDQTSPFIVKSDMNYRQFTWFNSWKNLFLIPNYYFSVQRAIPFPSLNKKKSAIQNFNNKESTQMHLINTTQYVDEYSINSSEHEKKNRKTSSCIMNQGIIHSSSEDDNNDVSEISKKSDISLSASKTSNDVINELLNKPNLSIIPPQQKKKRSKQGESSDIENSQDYVDKLIQQQTMQLFNI